MKIFYVSGRVNTFSINQLFLNLFHNNYTKIQLPNLKTSVVVNLDDKINCSGLAKLDRGALSKLTDIAKWTSSDANTMTGFGYSEDHIRCRENEIFYAMKDPDFFVLNLKFGDTPGVTESFGLFKKRMISLHHEHTKFIKHMPNYLIHEKVNKTMFYPSPNSVGGESHRRLLIQYAKTWNNISEPIEKRWIIQAPYFEQVEMKEFSVIPYVRRLPSMETVSPEGEKYLWDFLSALSEISKYFNSVLLSLSKEIALHDIWFLYEQTILTFLQLLE